MKALLIPLLFCVSHVVNAGQVSLLKLENEVVSFSIVNSKIHTLPACAGQEQSNLWAFSLANPSGRAMYSMLVTAVAAKIDISIEPALRCDVTGIETPKYLAFGSESNIPVNTAVYGSCDEILQNVPSAQDGHYTLSVGVGQVKVYCDMDWQTGGWTLVMRGKEGDVNGWDSSDFVNYTGNNTPSGGSFKLSDDLINVLKVTTYKMVLDESKSVSQKIRYFKGGCTYYHSLNLNGFNDCYISYSKESWTDAKGGDKRFAYHGTYSPSRGWNNQYYNARGLTDSKLTRVGSNPAGAYGASVFIGTISKKQNTQTPASWVVGDYSGGFKDGSGQDSLNYPYSSSFTVWVK